MIIESVEGGGWRVEGGDVSYARFRKFLTEWKRGPTGKTVW